MADKREAQLTLRIKSEGATQTANEVQRIAQGANALQKELGAIARSDQIDRLGIEMGMLAKKTKDTAAAAKELDKQLKAVGANDDEVRSAANAFAGAQGEGAGRNRFQQFGSELRSLPSVDLGPISSDQVAGIVRLGGALSEATNKIGFITAATTALTPALGGTAAGIVAVSAAAAPFVLAIGAIALAIKNFADEQAKQAAAINATVDAQRGVAQQIAEGLTTEEAKKQLDELNAKRKAEADLLARNQQIYTENIENQGALTAVLKATSGAEEALSGQIATSVTSIASMDTEAAALTRALEDGTLAANDAKIAEEELAKARTKAVLDSADAAGKELSAQQRALDATEEQNKERLETIGEERDVLQKQIDVLTESGDTSEQVTAKIAQLTGQLDLLGKESAFINDTALEASRQADAEKKAKKDAEDNAKKAQAAQEQYTKSVAAAGKTFIQSTEDIGTRFRNTIADNQEKFNRDTTDLATKYRRDEFDLTVKANRAERDAALDQINDLQKIQEDASKDEQTALQEGDFKALFLARQKTAEVLKQEQTAIDTSAQKRRLDIQDERTDLLQAAQRQRSDRMLGLERQSADARTAQSRELAQATLTRQRALQAAAEANNASLSQLQGYLNQRLKMESAYYNQSLGMGQGGAPKPGGFAAGNPFEKGVTQIIGRAIRK
jgi:hypothetical protein